VTKKEVLDFQLPPRFEQIGDEHRKQMEDGKHRLGFCPDSPSGANPRGWDFRERQRVNVPNDKCSDRAEDFEFTPMCPAQWIVER
jgi:hypothetical protein